MNKISRYDEELLVRVAWEYFINETSQVDIAKHFQVSRPTVSRLVKQAKLQGLVRITINSEFGLCIELEQEFQRRFGLKASIVPAGINTGSVADAVARAAAESLSNEIPKVRRIAVGWGRTISRIPHFARNELGGDFGQHLEMVEMVGNFLSTSSSLHSLRLATNLAHVFGATASVLSAPALAEDREMHVQLMSHTQIKSVLEKACQADIAIASLGPANDESTMFRLGLLTSEELESIQKLGAAGEVLGRFFDEQGNPISTSLDERLIGLRFEDLKKIPEVMIVASGEYKVRAIAGAIRGGVVTHLVTDDQTAQAVLDLQS